MKKVLYGILGLLSLLSLFILACVFRPDLSAKAAAFLYGDRETKEQEEERAGNAAAENARAGNHTGETAAAGTGSVPAGGTQEPAAVVPKGPTSDEVLGLNAVHTGQDTGTREEPASDRQEQQKPAEAVAGRGGYIPVQGESEQVDDKEAERLREQYTYGETGEGLDFDPEFYPYYAMLDNAGQALYRQIYANANAVNAVFNPVEPVSQGQLRNVFMAVFNDHPELFWLNSAYRGRFDRSGTCVEIVLEFNELTDNLEASKARFREEAEKILSGAGNLSTDYEVEVYVHNALLDKISYDLRAPLNQSAYSGLVNGKTVCAGYARAFQYLMTELGIPCYYCTGYAGEAHAWNIVRLDGEYYNVDATWDDTEPNTYDFFNKTDGEFGQNHRREDLSVNLPPCNGTWYANREKSPREGSGSYFSNAKTLQEAGFSEDSVILSLKDYYDDCYRQIMAKGGSCTFQNVVDSEKIWLQCYDAYNNDAYSAGYMDQVFTELGVSRCNVDIQAEPLQDGRFLLHHTIEFTQ